MKGLALAFFAIVIFSVSLHAQISDFGHIDFKKADSIAELYPKHTLKDLKILVDKLTKPLPTEAEKFRAIYKWVCNNIEYDYPTFLRNQQKRAKLKTQKERDEWNKKLSEIVFRNLLEHQRTVCSGYAYLVRELASRAGLSCIIIDGYGRTAQANIRGSGIANHSWNAIKLNNKWYLCDPTWSSGVHDLQKSMYVKKFEPTYFLSDPSSFVRNHYPLDSSWMLVDHKPTLKDFLNAPLVYSSTFQYQITQLQPETFDIAATKGKTVSFQFTINSERPIEKVALHIVKGSSTNTVFSQLSQKPSITSDEATVFHCIDHVFATKGTHIVHVILNESYAFTYSVKVR